MCDGSGSLVLNCLIAGNSAARGGAIACLGVRTFVETTVAPFACISQLVNSHPVPGVTFSVTVFDSAPRRMGARGRLSWTS